MNGILLGLFLAPIGLAIVSLLLRMYVPPEARRYGSATIRIAIELVAGPLLLVWSLLSVPGDVREARTYESDWTCREGTQLPVQTTGGPCTVVEATLTATSEVRRRSRHWTGTTYYYFAIAAWSGQHWKIPVGPGDENFAVWKAAKAQPGMDARVQLVHGRVALITTSAGTAETTDKPIDRLSNAEQLAALGAGLIVAPLLELLLAPMVLRPGW